MLGVSSAAVSLRRYYDFQWVVLPSFHMCVWCSVVMVVDTAPNVCEAPTPTHLVATCINPIENIGIIFTMLSQYNICTMCTREVVVTITHDMTYTQLHLRLSLTSSFSLPLSLPPDSRKEYRFAVDPTLTLANVLLKIREQTGLKQNVPFNLKWLDVEGEWYM